eukprot:CAMPEP_0185412504 /NCGR_PEP_ID=MMETSP1365-20130426/4282_1 /TAXON_ID=38817 /ORGANISM="Gephyrocapsa oceanica, Strain RCC1303" /LENGTH=139 /DNA_ID=CAMNT_0028015227 /DNA_START=20 /DNA_END=436 /DNA_ORIENTATION=-
MQRDMPMANTQQGTTQAWTCAARLSGARVCGSAPPPGGDGVHGAPTALSDARAHPKPHATASRHHAADVASAFARALRGALEEQVVPLAAAPDAVEPGALEVDALLRAAVRVGREGEEAALVAGPLLSEHRLGHHLRRG